MSLPERGTFAVVDSTTYEVTAAARDAVTLRVPREAGPLPPHLESGVRRDGDAWARVSKADLSRYFTVQVTVAWQGEEFGLGRVVGDEAEILGSSPVVAERLGLEGDQYNGFRGKVPVAELTVVDVREREIDV
ncbi:hypothetical protein IEZ26_03470 [Nocardioides cavernae]|uniref:Uncharacterized protein n=1 Tax=Nocardioides cavernae TaxID=1921566 RepID=A0ABR8N698_9ACTN|nr:hypothetical protein [Nocardioides cavernae]MBD3923668.1 hypothetical protein [Nocardioides cavernae]MBM7511400.1 hypothetical protein [Nocardioides cavernae]